MALVTSSCVPFRYAHTLAKVFQFHGRAALVRDPKLSNVVELTLQVFEMLPPTAAVCAEHAWPDEVISVFAEMLLDYHFQLDFPTFLCRVTPYMRILRPEAIERCERAHSVKNSIATCTAAFADRNTTPDVDSLHAVVMSAPALAYLADGQVVHNFVLACFDVASKDEIGPVREALIAAMNSPVKRLRYQTYKALVEVVDGLAPDGLTVFDASAKQLLCSPMIFDQIVVRGVHDPALESIPAGLLARLIVLFDSATISVNIRSVLPAVQAMMNSDLDGGLAQGILDILEPCQTHVQRVVTKCRFLFHKQPWLRTDASRCLAGELGLELKRGQPQPAHAKDPFNLPVDGIFLQGSANYTLPRSHVCQESEACRVLEVFTSASLDLQLRRAAAEQLAILCQHKQTCEVLHRHGLWESLWSETQVASSFVETTLAMIAMFVENLPELVGSVLDDIQKMGTLVAFAFDRQDSTRRVASRLLAAVLFAGCAPTPPPEPEPLESDEAAGRCWPRPMRLPAYVCANFRFCFPVVEAAAGRPAAAADEAIAQWVADAHGGSAESSTAQFVQNALGRIEQASNHAAAVASLSELQRVCSINRHAAEIFWASNWFPALSRYFGALPAALQDYDVLCSVMDLLVCILPANVVWQEDLDKLASFLQSLMNILRAFNSTDEVSPGAAATGWLSASIQPRTESDDCSMENIVVDRFSLTVLAFATAIIECEAGCCLYSSTASLLIISDCFSVVCADTFVKKGPRAYQIRAAVLDFVNTVLAHTQNVDVCIVSRLAVCSQLLAQIIIETAPVIARFHDDHLVRTALRGVRRCLELAPRSEELARACPLSPGFAGAVLAHMTACSSALRCDAGAVLRQMVWDPSYKAACQNVAVQCKVTDRMVDLALGNDEAFAVRAEALGVLSGMVRNGISIDKSDTNVRFSSYHEGLIDELVGKLTAPAPPLFVGRVCELLFWHLIRFESETIRAVDNEIVWDQLTSLLSIDSYWKGFGSWQESAAHAKSSRQDWLEANSEGLRTGAAHVLKLMRAVVVGGAWCCQPAAQLQLGVVTESVVRLFLVSPFDRRRHDTGEIALYRAGLDLLSMLFARTSPESQDDIMDQMRTAITSFDTIAVGADGSNFVETLCAAVDCDAAPQLQVSACRFVDTVMAHDCCLESLHISGAQCRALATTLAKVHAAGHGSTGGADATAFHAAHSALGQLLLRSHDAKAAALKSGLMPAVFGRLMAVVGVARLSQLSRADGQPPSEAERSVASGALHAELRLLKHFLNSSVDAKLATCDGKFLKVLGALWTLALEQPDSDSALHLVQVCANLVSDCGKATAWWDRQLVPSEHNVDAVSILSGATKLARKRHLRSDTGPSVFAMLRNFSALRSARLFLFKSGFIDHCTKLLTQPVNENARSHGRIADIVQLCVSITFSTDGQSTLLKTQPGLLPALVEQSSSPSLDVRRAAMFALRNLAFLRANKPQFLARKPTIPRIVEALGPPITAF